MTLRFRDYYRTIIENLTKGADDTIWNRRLLQKGWKKVGEGAFGAVYNNPKKNYVIKIYRKSDKGYDTYIDFLESQQGNPNVVRLKRKIYRVPEDESGELPQTYVDYITGLLIDGSLEDYAGYYIKIKDSRRGDVGNINNEDFKKLGLKLGKIDTSTAQIIATALNTESINIDDLKWNYTKKYTDGRDREISNKIIRNVVSLEILKEIEFSQEKVYNKYVNELLYNDIASAKIKDKPFDDLLDMIFRNANSKVMVDLNKFKENPKVVRKLKIKRRFFKRIKEDKQFQNLAKTMYDLRVYMEKKGVHHFMDLHSGNIMVRPSTGELVITDPLA